MNSNSYYEVINMNFKTFLGTNKHVKCFKTFFGCKQRYQTFIFIKTFSKSKQLEQSENNWNNRKITKVLQKPDEID